MMYKDDKDWDRHFEDWKKLLATAKWDSESITKTQHEYRIKIFERLMRDYDDRK